MSITIKDYKLAADEGRERQWFDHVGRPCCFTGEVCLPSNFPTDSRNIVHLVNIFGIRGLAWLCPETGYKTIKLLP